MKKNDHLRINCRETSTEILRASQNQEEKRFMWAILNYFMQENQPFNSDSKDDSLIKYIIDKGHDQATKTPSYLIANGILNLDNSKIMREEIVKVSRELSRYFERIVATYTALKLTLY